MPQIDYTRDEVKKMLPKWRLIRDCLSGQETIKEKGTEYLPMPNAEDKSEANRERYKAYKMRAVFMNAVDNTVQGLIGQVFSADPVVELPASMGILEEDADGEGLTLVQRAKRTLGDVLAVARCGLLVDFPEAPVDEAAEPDAEGNRPVRDWSRSEMQDGKARANILQFDAENVINWRTELVGGKRVLSLVVIAMKYVVYDDGFEVKYDDEWRVLRLVNGVYTCEVWRKSNDPAVPSTNSPAGGNQFVLNRTYVPRDANGKPLDFIPFTFVGAVNNNESCDKPPMYDIAVLNIAHYRNSADYEDAVFMVGQPTPVATGLTSSWVKEVWENKPMQIGSRAVVPLPAGGDFKMVAAEENGMVIEAMAQKERQMAMLGAQLVEKKEVQRTLGEAKLERAVVESVLVQCAKNAAAAIQQCLKWACLFYGEPDTGVVFELSTDFAIAKLTPEERKQVLAEWQGGLVTFEEARNQLRQSGIAYLEDAKAQQQLEAEAQSRVDLAATEAEALAAATAGSEDDQE